MKKILAVLLGMTMLVSCFALFTACGGKVYIKGDFSEEATAEEVQALKGQIRSADGSDKITLGDTTQTDWSYNLHEVSEGNVKYDMTLGILGEVATTDATMNVSTDYVYGLAKEGDTLALTGSGKVKASTKARASGGGKSGTVTASVSGNAYNEGDTLYLDGSIKSNGGGALGNVALDYTGKYKFPMTTVTNGFDLDSFASVGAVTSDIGDAIDLLVATFDSAGCKVYIDSSSAEVKVKVELDAKAYLDLVGLADMDVSDFGISNDQLLNTIKVSRAALYFSFNAESGLFTGYGVDVKISLKNFELTVDDDNFLKMNMDVSTNQWLLFTADTVDTPADLTVYENLEL